MAAMTTFLDAVRRLFAPTETTRRSGSAGSPTTRSPTTGSATGSRPHTRPTTDPGRGDGGAVTAEIDSKVVGRIVLGYTPKPDARPDPGEIVWTWVPYEENDGRGKDRPVLVVARLTASSVLAIQLTSKSHEGDYGALLLGSGPWDQGGRASWARIDRLFSVPDARMRREGAALDAERYDTVADALRARYHW